MSKSDTYLLDKFVDSGSLLPYFEITLVILINVHIQINVQIGMVI